MKNRIVRVLLMIMMVLSILPCMSRTAYADVYTTDLIPLHGWDGSGDHLTKSDLPFFAAVTEAEAKAWTGAPAQGESTLIYGEPDTDGSFPIAEFKDGSFVGTSNYTFTKDFIWDKHQEGHKFFYPLGPGYSVTLLGGANATINGNTKQIVAVGNPIEPVIYSANEGYFFSDFAIITYKGLTANTNGLGTLVTVFGTPTEDVSMTIPDALKKVKITTDTTYGEYGTVEGKDDDNNVLCPKNSDGKFVINVNPADGYTFGPINNTSVVGVEYDIVNNQILFSDETIESIGISFFKPLKIYFGSDHAELLQKMTEGMGGSIKSDGTYMIFDPRNIDDQNAYRYQVNLTSAFMDRIREIKGSCTDNGECFYYIGRKAKYTSDDEIAAEKADQSSKISDIIASGSFYMCWYNYSCDGNIEWTKGGSGSRDFEFKRSVLDKGFEFGGETIDVQPYSLAGTYALRGIVKIDDTDVTDKVTLSEGSLIVNVPDKILNELSSGTHTLKVLFEDSLEATKSFTVNDASKDDKKSSDSSPTVYKLPKTGIE